MTDFAESSVRHHGASLLNYAVWARMCGRPVQPVPSALADGAAQHDRLAPEARATVALYAERCWRLVCDEAEAAAHDAREAGARQAALRQRMPHLDEWTAGVLWNQAYRLAMQ